MWKSLHPGDQVKTGDIIRHISSLSKSAFGEKSYEVVKTDLHYFEIAQKPEKISPQESERKIIKYIEIGYHFLVEIWLEEANFPFLGQIV
jgi:hypothetical protein